MLRVRDFNRELVPAPSDDLELPSQPLDIDIGCGSGWHCIQRAKKFPNRNILGIERTHTRFKRFEGRCSRHPNLQNLFRVQADAVHWISHRLPLNYVDQYFLLYPNPEWKAKNRRWHQSPFFSRLKESLKPGGQITLATNLFEYIDEARAWVDACHFELSHSGVFRLELDPQRARTHFEKKYFLRSEDCFELRITRSVGELD